MSDSGSKNAAVSTINLGDDGRTKKKKKRNIIKFRDYEIDEDDFHVIDYFFRKSIRKTNPNTVFEAVRSGSLVISNDDKSNIDRRITGISLEFMGETGMQPLQIRKMDGLVQIFSKKDHAPLLLKSSNKDSDSTTTMTTTKDRNIVKFREFEIDEDDFHTLDHMVIGIVKTVPPFFLIYGRDCIQLRTVRDCILENFARIETSGQNTERRVTMLDYSGDTICSTGPATIPSDVVKLEGLESLICEMCVYLKTLPEEIGQLKNLLVLDLDYCVELEKIPITIGNLWKLEKLFLRNTRLTELPSSIGNLKFLEMLDIPVASLRNIHTSIGSIPNLDHLFATDIRWGPDGMELTDVDGNYLYEKRASPLNVLDPLRNLRHLYKLEISIQDFVRFQEDSFASFHNLKHLHLSWDVRDYTEIVSTPVKLPVPSSLEQIEIFYTGPNFNDEDQDVVDEDIHRLALFDSKWLSEFPELRECFISSSNSDSHSRPFVDLSDLQNLKRLETLKFDECELGISDAQPLTLSHFESIKDFSVRNCSGWIDFLDFNLDKLEKLELNCRSEHWSDHLLRFGKKNSSANSNDETKSFCLDTLGRCPNLKVMSIEDHKKDSCIKVNVSHKSLTLFPSIEDIKLVQCDIDFEVHGLDAPSTVLVSSLIKFASSNCRGFWNNKDSDSTMNLNLNLPSLTTFACENDERFNNKQLEELLPILRTSSPSIRQINLPSCNVTEISPKALSRMPKMISTLDLTGNSILCTEPGKVSLCKLLRRIKTMGCIGSLNAKYKGAPSMDTSNTTSIELGYLMSFNRARPKVLADQNFCAALWPLILKNANKVFRKNDTMDNFFCIKTESDAIFQILLERGAREIFMVADKKMKPHTKRPHAVNKSDDGDFFKHTKKRTKFYRE